MQSTELQRIFEREIHGATTRLITQAELPRPFADALHTGFTRLQGLKRNGLLLPSTWERRANGTLVLNYEESQSFAFLGQTDEAAFTDPDVILARWRRVAESLFALHNKGMVHGGLCPECFWRKGDDIWVGGFEWGILRAMGEPTALKLTAPFAAPETAAMPSEPISREADIYALARCLAHFAPQVKETEWFVRATEADASKRYHRMREFSDAMVEIPTPPQAIEAIAEPPAKPHHDSILVPRILLTADIEPAEAGSVQGAGFYPVGHSVELQAEALRDFVFVEWSGDVSGTNNPIDVWVEQDMHVKARFRAIATEIVQAPTGSTTRRLSSRVTTAARPPVAGKVTGEGDYILGQMIRIHAVPEPGWEFVQWEETATREPKFELRAGSEDLHFCAVFRTKRTGFAFNTEHKQVDPIPSTAPAVPPTTLSGLGKAFHKKNVSQ